MIVIVVGNDNDNFVNYNFGNCNGVVNVVFVGCDGGCVYYLNYGSNIDVVVLGGV